MDRPQRRRRRINLWAWYYVVRDAREGTSRHALAAIAVLIMVALAVAFAGAMVTASAGTTALSGLLRQQATMRVILSGPPGGSSSEAAPGTAAHGTTAPGTAARGTAAPDLSTKALEQQIAGLKGVRAVRFVGKQQTFAQMASAFAGHVRLQDVFVQNPFPDTLEIDLADPSAAPGLAASIGRMPGVDQVVYGQRYLQPLLGLANALSRFGWLAAAALGLIALLVAVVTWQLALLARAPEVRVKALMGVAPSAIWGQFLLEGALLGLAGGVLAALGLVYALQAVWQVVALIPGVVPGLPLLPLVGGCLAAGVVLGVAGAALAVARTWRRVAVAV